MGLPSRTLFFLAPSLIACASQWAPLDRAQLPNAQKYPEAAAVVLHESRRLELEPGPGLPTVKSTRRRQVLLLKPEGVKEAGLGHAYSRTFDEVLSVRARIVEPDGATKELDRSDFDDHPMFGETLYQDQRVLVHPVNALPVGTVVELEVVERSKDAPHFLHRFSFGDELPVEEAELIVHLPPGFQARHLVTRLWREEAWPPEEQATEDGGRRWRWRAGPLPPIRPEAFAPSNADLGLWVMVQLTEWPGGRGFKDFEDYGRFLFELQAGTAEVTPRIQKQTEELLFGVGDDPVERARRLYDWVRTNIRYVAVEIGQGGWRPHLADEILEWRYGDCKDKATLLKAMLKVAGIESHLVEIYSHAGLPRRMMMPGLGSSNHAIIAIELPDGRLLADPTASTVPFGELPSSDQEAEVLLIRDRGAEVVTAPGLEAAANRREIEVQLQLEPEGKITGTVRTNLTGEYASRWDAQRQGTSHDDHDEHLLAWVGAQGALASDLSQPEPERGQPRVVTAKLQYRSGATRAGDRLVLRPADLLAPSAPNLPPPPRQGPWLTRNRYTHLRRLVLQPAPGLVASGVPEPVHLETRFGSYHAGWTVSGGAVTFEGTLVLRERIVPSEAYGELKAFFDGIIAAESRPVLFGSGGAR